MELTSTRRELLLSLLGASVAAGCARRAPEIGFEGGFVDLGMSDGHRLRDGVFSRPAPPVEPRRVSVAILGAGVSGLSAGWALRRAGVEDFVILELEDAIGGTARSGRAGAVEFPWGAHYVPAPTSENSDLVALFEETGTVVGRGPDGEPTFAETHLVAAPKERIFFRGVWLEGHFPRAGASSVDLEQMARFGRAVSRFIGLRDADGRRAFTLPASRSGDSPELRALDGRSMADWLDAEGITSRLVREYIELGARDDFGTRLEDLSAWHGLHYFAARTPAPGRESAEFLTWPKGNGFLVEHLAERAGQARIERGVLVTSVAPEGDGRRARVTAWNRKASRFEAITADRVIFALPSFLRRYLLDPRLGAPAYTPEYVPWVVANLSLSGRPGSFGFVTAWDNVIHGSRSLGYVVATHQKHVDEGPTVWTYYLPLCGRDPRGERARLLGLAYRELADAVVADLDACHEELRPLIERVDIMRFGHAMVRPSPGTMFSAARRAAAEPVGPVHFAHTDLSGMALFEEAFSHGLRAAREVCARLDVRG